MTNQDIFLRNVNAIRSIRELTTPLLERVHRGDSSAALASRLEEAEEILETTLNDLRDGMEIV